jgi:hypothetical protein
VPVAYPALAAALGAAAGGATVAAVIQTFIINLFLGAIEFTDADGQTWRA